MFKKNKALFIRYSTFCYFTFLYLFLSICLHNDLCSLSEIYLTILAVVFVNFQTSSRLKFAIKFLWSFWSRTVKKDKTKRKAKKLIEKAFMFFFPITLSVQERCKLSSSIIANTNKIYTMVKFDIIWNRTIFSMKIRRGRRA